MVTRNALIITIGASEVRGLIMHTQLSRGSFQSIPYPPGLIIPGCSFQSIPCPLSPAFIPLACQIPPVVTKD